MTSVTQIRRQNEDRTAQRRRERAGTHLLRIDIDTTFSLSAHYRPTSTPPELREPEKYCRLHRGRGVLEGFECQVAKDKI
jgi:hypothetical protein